MANLQKNYQPTAGDIALNKFRCLFPAGFLRCNIISDTRMNYSLPNLRAAHDTLTKAHKIIQDNKLPLMASAYTDYKNHIVSIVFYL